MAIAILPVVEKIEGLGNVFKGGGGHGWLLSRPGVVARTAKVQWQVG